MNLRYFFAAIIAVFALVACVQKKESTEMGKKPQTLNEIANDRVEIYLRSISADPDISVMPQSKNVEYLTDSLCVLEFNCRGRNSLGGYSIELAEYVIFVNDDGKKYEDIFLFKDTHGIVNRAQISFKDKDPASNILHYMKDQLKNYINPPLVP